MQILFFHRIKTKQQLKAASVDAILLHLWLCLLFLQENVFCKLSHGSLPTDTVAGVFGSIDGHRGSVSRHGAQTSQVQDFDIWYIITFKTNKKKTV